MPLAVAFALALSVSPPGPAADPPARPAAQRKAAMPAAEFKALTDGVEKEVRQINQAEAGVRAARFAAVHSRIDRALALWPGDAALHHLKAQVYAAQSDAQGAEAELKRALELDPDYTPALGALGTLYLNTKRTDEARAQFEAWARKRPEDPAPYLMLGMVYDAQKNYDEALHSYRRVLSLAPRQDVAANNLAWLYAEHGKGDANEAVRQAWRVVERHPKEPGFADTLGWAYYRMGAYMSAVAHLQRAVSLTQARGRDSALYRFHLGMALARTGDKEGARRELRRALELGGDNFEQAGVARKALAAL